MKNPVCIFKTNFQVNTKPCVFVTAEQSANNSVYTIQRCNAVQICVRCTWSRQSQIVKSNFSTSMINTAFSLLKGPYMYWLPKQHKKPPNIVHYNCNQSISALTFSLTSIENVMTNVCNNYIYVWPYHQPGTKRIKFYIQLRFV